MRRPAYANFAQIHRQFIPDERSIQTGVHSVPNLKPEHDTRCYILRAGDLVDNQRGLSIFFVRLGLRDEM
jgi:hypothetical protein